MYDILFFLLASCVHVMPTFGEDERRGIFIGFFCKVCC